MPVFPDLGELRSLQISPYDNRYFVTSRVPNPRDFMETVSIYTLHTRD